MEHSKFGFKINAYWAIKDSVIFFITWFITLWLATTLGKKDDYAYVWILDILPAIPLYILSYTLLIPQVKNADRNFGRYIVQFALIAGVGLILTHGLYAVVFNDYRLDALLILALIYLGFQLLIVAPAAWLGYHYRLAKINEPASLEIATDQSSPTLVTLHTQTNPHFLSNAFNVFKKPVTFKKVEFWVVTIIYACSALVLLGQVLDPYRNSNLFGGNYYHLFHRNHIPYSFAWDSALPKACKFTTLYIGFILFNFFIADSLIKGRRIAINLLLLFGLYVIVVIGLGAADTWLRGYLLAIDSEETVYNELFREEAIRTFITLALLIGYTIAKYISRLVMLTLEKTFTVDKKVTDECLVAFGMWALTVYFLSVSYLNGKASVIWCEASLFGIILYWYLYNKVIPDVITTAGKFREYLLSVLVILFITVPPITMVAYLIFHRLNATFYIAVLNIGLNLFVVAPFAWFLYNYRFVKSKELTGLKTALGQSSANLGFLRSQINPHFLFNALNTLYATALQEKADRTSEGIQKLGDMMRFMLQENVQEFISLSREVDYLNNYIALQKLRTQASADIVIQTEIEEQDNYQQIAPMLLIPFVENAFKHGISLKEPSHIKITLNTKDNDLFFDVTNSVHPKKNNDPEKDRSGIGLENVKDRLRLLYPDDHELIIRESAKEFFIHLTLNLKPNRFI